ncbi:MAG: hypothetical protein AMXMBFR13_07750 [Phycisphaerae bacterium]
MQHQRTVELHLLRPGLISAAVLGAALAANALLIAGCGQTAAQPPVTTAPAGPQLAGELAPLPLPADFDRERAMLALPQIPGDPPAPTKGDPAADAELPRQALRRIEEARRLFAEQRFSETITELERALRYNANSHEAHRMMALACLLSGSIDCARASAERALAIQPDDLACHYVLGRVAEKDEAPEKAMQRYRTALKCEALPEDAPYRALTHFYLGNLLYEARYYAAAIEQLKAFEEGLRALGEQVEHHPELATVARVQRGPAAIRVARGLGLLGDYAAAAEALRIAAEQSPQDTSIRAERIRMLARASRMEEAAREAEQFVRESGADREAIRLLLSVHRLSGHPERGVAVVGEMARQHPENMELWLLYVDALAAAKQFDRAVVALDEMLTRHPGAAQARWRLIQLTRERGQWAAWLKALAGHLAASQPADTERLDAELAGVPAETGQRILRAAEKPEGTDRALLPELAGEPTAQAALDSLLGRLAVRLGQDERALALYTRALAQSPGFLPAAAGASTWLIERCRWGEAIETLESARRSRTDPSAELEHLLGRACDGLDQIEKAAAHYEKAIELDRSDAKSMLLLGQMYDRVGRSAEARRQFQAAVAAAPNDMTTREALLRHLLRPPVTDPDKTLTRVAAELADMRRLAANDPATIRCGVLVARATDTQQPEENLDALRQLVEAHPEEAQSREDLATTLLELRDYQAARKEAAELLRLHPYSADANELMSLALMRLLDLEATQRQLSRMLELYPNREPWIVSMGQLRLIQQEYDAAIAAWERVLKMDHTADRHPIYRRALQEVYREAHRFDEARRIAQQWIDAGTDDARELSRYRWFLLAADAAAGDLSTYIRRCREWLKDEEKGHQVFGWLLGVRTSEPGVLGSITAPAGLVGAGRHDEAALLVLERLSESPGDIELVALVIAVLQNAGRYDQAIEVARAQVSAADTPDRRMIWLELLRESYHRAGRYDEAIATVREFQRLLGESAAQLDRVLATTLSQAGRFDAAVAVINKQLEQIEEQKGRLEMVRAREQNAGRLRQFDAYGELLRRQQTEWLRSLSYLYQRAGQTEVAVQRLRDAHRLNPRDVGINNDLGYTLAEAGRDLDEAEQMTRIAVAEELRNAAYQDSLAWVLYKKGDFQGAYTWLTRGAALEDGQDPVIFDHLGDACWRLGREDEAVRNWQRSVELHERQAAQGEADVDHQKIVQQVKAKLEAVRKGGKPETASTAAETQPAP